MIRLFRLLVPASVLALFLSEAAIIYGSYAAVAYYGRTDGVTFLNEDAGWQRIGLLTGLILAGMYFRQLYGDLRVLSRILLLQQLALVMGIVFLAESLIGYANLAWSVPRWIVLPGSALVALLVFGWRILFSIGIQNKIGLRRVLFLGYSPAVAQITDYLTKHPEVGFAPIGYLDHDDAVSEVGPRLARLGDATHLYGVLDAVRPDWLVVGKRDQIDASRANDFLEMRFGGVETEDAAGFFEKTLGRICAAEVRPRDLLWSETLQPNPLNARLQPMYSTLMALLLAVPLLPFALLSVMCAAGAKGSLLLREQRLGMYGELFTAYLFRCPRNGAGKLLRRFGLDRLPQIWNVLRGQMAFVGPEADRPEYASRIGEAIPFYAHRRSVRPGITGWAQISQAVDGTEGDALRRLEYDLYYVKNMSPLLDVFVLLRSLREMAFARPDES